MTTKNIQITLHCICQDYYMTVFVLSVRKHLPCLSLNEPLPPQIISNMLMFCQKGVLKYFFVENTYSTNR